MSHISLSEQLTQGKGSSKWSWACKHQCSQGWYVSWLTNITFVLIHCQFSAQDIVSHPLYNWLMLIDRSVAHRQELNCVTHMLNHPSEFLIFEPNFLYIVECINVCIAFMRNHIHLSLVWILMATSLVVF